MRFIFALTIIIGCAEVAMGLGMPPTVQQNMPGNVVGTIHTRWLGPRVSMTKRQIGESGSNSVRWFTPEGRTNREISGSIIAGDPEGFIEFFHNQTITIYGVYGGWQLTLPKKAGPAGFITGTPDSRVFVDEFHPADGQIAADIYLSGKLATTIGPYIQHRADDVHLGDDGSVALLIWKSAAKRMMQIVGVGPDGKELFRTDCAAASMAPVPAPDGSTVLIESNDDRHVFSLYAAAGKISSLTMGPNARFVAWKPGSTTALMQTSIGHTSRWILVDWQNGKVLWNVADPNPARPDWSGADSIVTKNYVLIAGQEYRSNVPAQSIYALSTRNGQIVAHWLPNYFGYPMIEQDTFRRIGGHIYLISDRECSQINLNEIANYRAGWK